MTLCGAAKYLGSMKWTNLRRERFRRVVQRGFVSFSKQAACNTVGSPQTSHIMVLAIWSLRACVIIPKGPRTQTIGF